MSALIRYIQQDHFIHVASRDMEVNLCSRAIIGNDDSTDGVEVKAQLITCPTCILIIRLVKAIPNKFIPKS